MKLFFLELILTKKCNQTCSYCDVYPLTKYKKDDIVEVDLDYLKYVLSCFNDCNLYVELCGGEPGIVQNFKEVCDTILDLGYVKKFQVMSNGLVRKLHQDTIENPRVIYNEHLIKNIQGTTLNKFYDMSFEERDNWKYVIVTSPQTTRSLLENYKHFLSIGLFQDHFWYKIMIDKGLTIDKHSDDLKELYQKLGKESELRFLEYFNNKDVDIKRKWCALNSPLPGIDFETKELMHCCSSLTKTKRVPFNNQNVELLKKNKLFKLDDQCSECYVLDDSPDKMKCILECNKGNYNNRGKNWS